jgi:hypothetical protein
MVRTSKAHLIATGILAGASLLACTASPTPPAAPSAPAWQAVAGAVEGAAAHASKSILGVADDRVTLLDEQASARAIRRAMTAGDDDRTTLLQEQAAARSLRSTGVGSAAGTTGPVTWPSWKLDILQFE